MGIITPVSMPPQCPDCCDDLPGVLHGSADHATDGNFVFDFIQDLIWPCNFTSPAQPPPAGPFWFAAIFCEVGGRLTLLVPPIADECRIENNQCEMPAQCTTPGGWTLRIWQ